MTRLTTSRLPAPRRARWALSALAVLAVAGCATFGPSAETCRTKDWAALGREDGSEGRPSVRREPLFRQCREAGAPPDLAAYRAGRREGLAEYCTEANGAEVGRTGARYYGVCPPDLEPAFLEGLRRGREAFARNPPRRRYSLRPYHFGYPFGFPPHFWPYPYYRYGPGVHFRFGYGVHVH